MNSHALRAKQIFVLQDQLANSYPLHALNIRLIPFPDTVTYSHF